MRGKSVRASTTAVSASQQAQRTRRIAWRTGPHPLWPYGAGCAANATDACYRLSKAGRAQKARAATSRMRVPGAGNGAALAPRRMHTAHDSACTRARQGGQGYEQGSNEVQVASL